MYRVSICSFYQTTMMDLTLWLMLGCLLIAWAQSSARTGGGQCRCPLSSGTEKMSTVYGLCHSRGETIYCGNSDWTLLTRTISMDSLESEKLCSILTYLNPLSFSLSTTAEAARLSHSSWLCSRCPSCCPSSVLPSKLCSIYFWKHSSKSTFTQPLFQLSHHKCPLSHHCHYCYYQNQHHYFHK